MDAEAAVDRQQPGIKGHVVTGTGAEAVLWIEPLRGSAHTPGFDVAGHEHARSATLRRLNVESTKNTPMAMVAENLKSKAVLPHAG